MDARPLTCRGADTLAAVGSGIVGAMSGPPILIARTPNPPEVTSNIGHISEPVEITLTLDGKASRVTISEGSGHLGSGGSFPLAALLGSDGRLQGRWVGVFGRAQARWVEPVLARLDRGERVGADDIERARSRRKR